LIAVHSVVLPGAVAVLVALPVMAVANCRVFCMRDMMDHVSTTS
jgi:hypothetical protein